MSEQQIIPAGAPTPFLTNAQNGLGGRMNGAFAFLRQPAVSRALPAVAMVSVLGLAAAAWLTLQSPTQAPLYSGLAETDKAVVAEALQASGIGYTLDPASGALSVDADKLHEAKMMLAGQGLPKAQPSGDAMLAALPMGASRAIEGEMLRGAREADLARTIEAIDAVKIARVHLALAEPSVFVREEKPAAASVLLTLQQGRSLSEAQVRAIRHLVASSVPGLSAEQVSVIDQSGALLSGVESANSALLDLQSRIEARYRAALISLLTPVLGRDAFSVEVNAEVDASESQATRENFPEDSRVLTREEGSNSRNGSAATPAVGIPGAMSNQPPPATGLSTTPPAGAPATQAATQGSSEENFSRSFALGREISVTHQPQGQLKRLSVAVALRQKGKPLSEADIAKIDALVKGAVGFNAERGDQVAISARPFAEIAAPEVAPWDELWFWPLLRQVGAVVGALAVLLVVGLPLRKAMKRRAAEASERAALIENQLLEATVDAAKASVKSDGQDITLAMIEAAPGYEARAQLVRAFVQQDPERAAHIVRHLMQERGRGS
ncbi:flagellar basal-body MS-ring/collar protein FliF [uncultured Sphingorhabdus sp.]|uniref:flagellar basal-body MS-ring/collar protein FliF n=1 Tax=uncultured Sphingorhabdus sp. TaxID=1686106 RepID=UPI00262E8B0E|nr:flagellar basal-body MS-ring/collar protein FliF [uncultured Sphingorhabdus sp.]HMS19820.1 flagellar basal-body MS-ring/collar protein FliF [Sphingorhabdus sp.]